MKVKREQNHLHGKGDTGGDVVQVGWHRGVVMVQYSRSMAVCCTVYSICTVVCWALPRFTNFPPLNPVTSCSCSLCNSAEFENEMYENSRKDRGPERAYILLMYRSYLKPKSLKFGLDE